MITTAILLLGSCGTASQTITVEPSIERIVLRCAIGGVKDVLSGQSLDTTRLGSGLRDNVRLPTLRIDGHSQTGVFAWLAAANRVAGYALERRTSGSVEYAYRIWYQEFDVHRATRVAPGSLALTTNIYGSIGPKGELHHVVLALRATEREGRTILVGEATGYSTIGSRRWLLRWLANRRAKRGKCQPLQEFIGSEIAKELDANLLTVLNQGGRRLYNQGDLHQIVIEFIKNLKEPTR